MAKRIAQIGTFDIENFGDLLFPTMIAHIFSEDMIDIFSIGGNCTKPFEDSINVYPVSELENMHCQNPYDAIIIGGGDIILCDVNESSKYLWDSCDLFKLWAFPILVGNKYNIPVVFNAPGVPYQFNKSMRGLVGALLNKIDYVSVRDESSAAFLRECGVANVKVIPDTIIEIVDVFHPSMLEEIRKQLRLRYALPGDNSYIIMQHNTFQITNPVYKNYYKNTVHKVIETGMNVVFMPIGYVHEDGDFLRQIYDSKDDKQFLVNEKLSPIEMCAVLAGSNGYIGSSMHGAVVSYAYNKFAVCINTKKYTKTTGLLKQLGHPEWEVKDIAELETTFTRIYSNEHNFSSVVHDKIKKHFTDIKEIINRPHAAKKVPDVLKEYFELEKKINDSAKRDFSVATAYFDFGNGYEAFKSCEVAYKMLADGQRYFHLNIPNNALKVRIDLVEDSLLLVESLKVLIDGASYEPVISNKMELETDYLINSLMPSVECECEKNKSFELFLNAQPTTLKQVQELIGKIHYNSMLQGQAYTEKIVSLENENKQSQKELEHISSVYAEEKNTLLEKNKVLSAEYDELKKKHSEEIHIIEKKAADQVEKSNLEKEALNNEINVLNQKIIALNGLTEQIDALNTQVDALNTSNLEIRNSLSLKEDEVECIKNSICWKLTSPIRATGNGLYRLMMKTYVTQCALEAIKILFQKGPVEVVHACRRFIDRSLHSQEANAMLPNRSVNNKDGYLPYDSEYQANIKFDGMPDVKMLAFYLPQYHTFPENDEWWGKGFTEWVNVKNGTARFEGHYQPRVPHKDIGYYNLEDISVLKRQAELAKEHGIYGFCFYYYWFSGKRLMEKPVDMLLEHPEIDLPFCLCWANENWTRAWDGQNRNVLIAQDYSDEDDERFMVDLEKYISDERYIRINGKPLVIVYNPGQIPDCHKSFEKWRECARKIGIGEILIWTCQTANNSADILNISDCIDAEVEFPPHNMWLESIAVRDLDLRGKSAFIYNYQCLVEYQTKKLEENERTTVPVHHGCMLAWDNAARRKDAWFTYYAFSLKSLYKWVNALVDNARKNYDSEERFVFVNAWNEWGEGTYLEPDEKYGYANINTISKALYGRPFRDDITFINNNSPKLEIIEENSSIAVQIHMFYLETMDETIENLNYIPFKYDCYISTDCEEKKRIIENTFKLKSTCNKYQVKVFENRGRDVAPFIEQMSPIISDYTYICHIHSKKTKTGEYGNEWRKYIFRHLFGSKEYMKALFAEFENNDRLGIIMPETFPVLELQAEWGGNLDGVKALLERLDCTQEQLSEDPVFPVGNMFWARSEAVLPMFTHGIKQSDFSEEQGQTNATIAHQIERSWIYVAEHNGYTYQKLFNNCREDFKLSEIKRIGIFVHYDKKNVISEEDITSVCAYSKIFDALVFVTNSDLKNSELEKIKPYVSKCICRENKGLDFGAWKEAILLLGREKLTEYDELVLCNNSCFAPIFPLEKMFYEMEQENVDFWGNCIFPYLPDGSYIHKDCIPEHLQSYFTVYNKRVLSSNVFWKFWEEIPVYENYIDVVGNCESQFTKILADAGFIYSPYVKESYYICQYLQNYSVPYEKPTSLLLLNSPFVKKKCYEYMDSGEKNKLESYIKALRSSCIL